jgi:hypothetical protein
MASGSTISLAPVEGGWAVILTDGRELARFIGPDAHRQALGYAASTNPVRRRPLIDKVRRTREKRGGRRTASNQS